MAEDGSTGRRYGYARVCAGVFLVALGWSAYSVHAAVGRRTGGLEASPRTGAVARATAFARALGVGAGDVVLRVNDLDAQSLPIPSAWAWRLDSSAGVVNYLELRASNGTTRAVALPSHAQGWADVLAMGAPALFAGCALWCACLAAYRRAPEVRARAVLLAFGAAAGGSLCLLAYRNVLGPEYGWIHPVWGAISWFLQLTYGCLLAIVGLFGVAHLFHLLGDRAGPGGRRRGRILLLGLVLGGAPLVLARVSAINQPGPILPYEVAALAAFVLPIAVLVADAQGMRRPASLLVGVLLIVSGVAFGAGRARGAVLPGPSACTDAWIQSAKPTEARERRFVHAVGQACLADDAARAAQLAEAYEGAFPEGAHLASMLRVRFDTALKRGDTLPQARPVLSRWEGELQFDADTAVQMRLALADAYVNEDEISAAIELIEETRRLPVVIEGAGWADYLAGRLDALRLIGQPFDDFAVRDLDGNPLSVARFRGQVVLVDFWATWCGPCIGELPHLKDAYEKYHDDGFEIIGLSRDMDEEALRTFIAEEGIAWPQHLDRPEHDEDSLSARYGVTGIPTSYLIDRDGRIHRKDLRGHALVEAVGRLTQG